MNGLIFRWHFLVGILDGFVDIGVELLFLLSQKTLTLDCTPIMSHVFMFRGFFFIFKTNVSDVLHVIDKHNIILDVLVAQNSEEIIFI